MKGLGFRMGGKVRSVRSKIVQMLIVAFSFRVISLVYFPLIPYPLNLLAFNFFAVFAFDLVLCPCDGNPCFNLIPLYEFIVINLAIFSRALFSSFFLFSNNSLFSSDSSPIFVLYDIPSWSHRVCTAVCPFTIVKYFMTVKFVVVIF